MPETESVATAIAAFILDMERERCARTAESMIPPHQFYEGQRAAGQTARDIAAKIRSGE